MPQSDVPGEKTSPTQPFPTKPAAFDRQGITMDDLIDFTPELKAEALKIASQYKLGPVYTPWQMRDEGGKTAAIILPNHTGGSNWPGGAADPETGIVYVASLTNPDTLTIAAADPKRSDMGYVGGGGGRPGGVAVAARAARRRAGGAGADRALAGAEASARAAIRAKERRAAGAAWDRKDCL